MKILFMMRYYSYIAHYEDSLKLLAQKGARIHFSFHELPNKPFDAERMKSAYASIPNTSYDFFPLRVSGRWTALGTAVRAVMDHVRYLHPDYKHAPKLSARFAKRIPKPLQSLLRALCRLFGMDRVVGFLKWIEGAIPVDEAALEYLKRHDPAAILFTPLLDSNTQFIDFAKAARRLGIPTAVCVASWDNLTNKGLIQIRVDKVLVWNHFQQSEALRYHAVPKETLRVTGAQTFDKWFARKPSLNRSEFMKRMGLEGYDGYVTYLCSSKFIAEGDEAAFVRSWVQKLRSNPAFDRTALVVRPHPANYLPFEKENYSEFRGVAVYPRWQGIPYPFTEADRSDYFNTLHYATAVVGVNTSAMIEAGIQEKPVFTIVAPEFGDTQAGTLHFKLLKKLLRESADLDAHSSVLEEAVDGRMNGRVEIREFIRDFLRPHGLERPASPLVAAEIEELAARGRGPGEREGWDVPLRRILFYPLAWLAGHFQVGSRKKKRS